MRRTEDSEQELQRKWTEVNERMKRLLSTMGLTQMASVEIGEIPGGYTVSVSLLGIVDEHIYVSNRKQAIQIVQDKINAMLQGQLDQLLRASKEVMSHPHYKKLYPEAERYNWENSMREVVANPPRVELLQEGQ